MLKKQILFTLLMFICLGTSVTAQGIQTEFGKNRVQYHDFEWNFYETDNYIVYFYQGGQDLAKFTLQVAENERLKIEDKLEHQLSTKVELLVYHNLSDLLQTNVGLGLDQSNRGGQTQIVGSKVFVYFNGNHQHLKKQIVEGVARVHFEQLTFGSSLQEILQNAVLLNLPPWFTDGLIAYVTEDWNIELDNKLRALISAGKQPRFNRLQPEEARFTGHALWHYIAQNYGKNSIPNVLYLTRINRSIDSGFTFVFGNDVEQIVNEWWQTLQTEYGIEKREELNTEEALFATQKKQREKVVSQLKLSPNGKWLTYAINDKGKIKVLLREMETGVEKVLLKKGFKTYELPLGYNYPLLAWDEKGRKLAIVYQHRDVIYLQQYMPETNEMEEAPMTKFQQVLSLDYTDDNRRLVLAAVQNGQADLFTYFISNTKTRKLTDDFYDEMDISYGEIAGRKGVLFLSNRKNDTLRNEQLDTLLPTGNMDVFFYDLNPIATQPLLQLTNTPNENELSPRFYGNGLLSVLGAQNGIYNQYVIQPDSLLYQTDRIVFFRDSTATNPTYPLDSLNKLGLIDSIVNKKTYKYFGRSFPQTDYQYHLNNYDVSAAKKQSIFLQKTDGRYFFYTKPYETNPLANKTPLSKTAYKKQLTSFGKTDSVALEQQINASLPTTEAGVLTDDSIYNLDSTRLDTLTYFFQSEFDWINEEDEELAIYQFNQPTKNRNKNEAKKPLKLSRVRTYAPKFAIDKLAGQFGNSIFPFNQYEPYDNSATIGNNAFNFNPANRMLFSAGINDLFEDYRLLGGFRTTFDLSLIEYFIEYRNLSKQLDHHWLIYRKTERRNSDQNPQTDRLVTNYIQKTFVYPLDIVSRVGAHIGLRQNKIVPLINNDQARNKATTQQQYLQAKLEYVFDNTVQVTQNVLNGSRAKVYTEIYKRFSATINDTDFDFKWNDQGWFGVIGGDFRHYQPIHRQIVWANRFSFGLSFGKERVLYYLGGVDHWISLGGQDRRFNQDSPVNQEANYAFQSLAPHLRGFKYNVRNGSKHALWNSEIRVPVFTYLFNRPIRSQFIRNFMLVGFTDAGTAWEEGNPFDAEKRYAVDIISNNSDPGDTNPVEVRIRYFRNPIVVGYGYGFRSTFLGYYLKLDRAWGRDSGVTGEDRWYLSIGLDF